MSKRIVYNSEKAKTCNHESTYKEYIGGGDTGDYICTNCGEAGDRDWAIKCRDQAAKEKSDV